MGQEDQCSQNDSQWQRDAALIHRLVVMQAHKVFRKRLRFPGMFEYLCHPAGGWCPLTTTLQGLRGVTAIRLAQTTSPRQQFDFLAAVYPSTRAILSILHHRHSNTLLLIFTGLQASHASTGLHLLTGAVLHPFRESERWHMGDRDRDRDLDQAPNPTAIASEATPMVHIGLWSMLQEYRSSIEQAYNRTRPRQVMIAGFSLGGAMSNMLSQYLSLPPKVMLTSVAIGAPRTGNAAWSRLFEQRSDTRAHINIVTATLGRAPAAKHLYIAVPATVGVCVDEVTCIPPTRNGFQSCSPQLLVIDSQTPGAALIVMNAPVKLLTADVTPPAHQSSFLFHCLRTYFSGFSPQHRVPGIAPAPVLPARSSSTISMSKLLWLVLIAVVAWMAISPGRR